MTTDLIDLHTVKTLVRRELRDSLRDWRIVVPIVLLTAIFPFLTNLAAQMAFDFLEGYGAIVIGERMVPFGMMVVGFFPITLSLVLALETFVGEKERNTLEALFATPASDLELYLGKLISALVLPLCAAYAGIAIYLVTASVGGGVELPGLLLAQVLLLTTLEALVMVSGAVIVSSHTTSVRAANLLASFIIVPTALLLQVEAGLMFWGAYQALWYVALALVVVNAILIRAGMRSFNREEVLSRELDTLNLRRVGKDVGRLWLAPPGHARIALRTGEALPRWSFKRFYAHDLPRLLRSGRFALGASAAIMLLGFLFGWGLAQRFPLTGAFANFDAVASTISRGNLSEMPAGGAGLLPEFSAGAILMHNLRATVLTLMFAVLSFGSISMLLAGLPMAVLGFLAGQVGGAGSNPLQFLAAFVLPHGVVELPATLIAAAFALRIGAMLIAPPRSLTVGEGLLLGLTDFAKVFLFVVLPLLGVASLLEVYVTPLVIQLLY